jgi:hypothetical protein
LSEVVLVFADLWVPLFMGNIEGAFSEEMSLLMTFPASERDVFIVDGLGPILVMVFENYGSRERLGYVQVYANARIGGVSPLLGGL